MFWNILLVFIAFWWLAPMVLVAIGMPFSVARPSNKRFSIHAMPDKIKRDIDLPNWLRWLQNPEDGLTGDDRGWYWNTYWPGKSAWFKMWWWSGVRNQWNYLKRFVLGIDIRKFEIVKVCGADYVRDDLKNQGFQILMAYSVYGVIPRPMLYWVKELHNGRGICLQIGWKIKLSHNSTSYEDEWDYFKGVTLEPNFYKDLT